MKIAQFSFGDTVGAFGAAYELHKCLRMQNVESTFFVRQKTRDDDSIIELPFENCIEEKLLRVINCWYFNENKKEGSSLLSLHTLGLQWDDGLEKVFKEYDIFHIHWIPGLLSVKNIYEILTLNKPVFWTMHDFNPFTGGCHYPEECNEYERDCSQCPQFRNDEYNISKYILQDKMNAYGNGIITIVASNWLKNIVKKSIVFHDSKCIVIPIGVDVNTFKILDKKEIKKKYGIAEEKKVILFGAQSLSQNIKGYVYLDKVLKKIEEDAYFADLISKNQFEIITFGSGSGGINYGNIPHKEFGYIDDRDKLCDLYNIADVFVFPSVQETFGMAATEAMACGTPVVAFDICAMHDVIINGVNGFKVSLGNYEDMFKRIKEVVRNKNIDRLQCRTRIVEEYSLENETQKIINLYNYCFVNSNASLNIKEWKEPKASNEFVRKCTRDVREGCALNQTMSYESICMDYNPFFISPESKVADLIKKGYLDENTSVYIYGTGMQGRKMMKALEKNQIKIIGFWDSDEQKWNTSIDNYKVLQPYEKKTCSINKIIIATMAYETIAEYLFSIGYENGDFY